MFYEAVKMHLNQTVFKKGVTTNDIKRTADSQQRNQRVVCPSELGSRVMGRLGYNKHKDIVGSRSSQTVGSLCSSYRTMDLYVGYCTLNTVSDELVYQCKNVCNLKVSSAVELPSKSIYFKAFKLSMSYRNKETLLDPNLWPEGIIVRKFYKPSTNLNLRIILKILNKSNQN